MPTTRRRRTRGRTVLTLEAIGLRARIEFLVGWRPPTTEGERQRSRWRTYRDFLDEYAAVRGDMLARHSSQPDDFAEGLYQRVVVDPGGAVEAHGAALYGAKFHPGRAAESGG